MEEEHYFSDESIIEQSSAMIQQKDGKLTNGVSLIIECPPGVHAVEILLTYEELKVVLVELSIDREARPRLYA
jgi:hypothetical protein